MIASPVVALPPDLYPLEGLEEAASWVHVRQALFSWLGRHWCPLPFLKPGISQLRPHYLQRQSLSPQLGHGRLAAKRGAAPEQEPAKLMLNCVEPVAFD